MALCVEAAIESKRRLVASRSAACGGAGLSPVPPLSSRALLLITVGPLDAPDPFLRSSPSVLPRRERFRCHGNVDRAGTDTRCTYGS